MCPFNKKKTVPENTAKLQQITDKTYAQLKEEYRQLEIENAEQEDKCAKEGLDWTDMLLKTRDIKEKMAYVDKMMRKIQEPSLIYNKKWKGKKILLEDFISASVAKEITDSSGEGYYATETAKTDVRIYPSDITQNIYRAEFPYIIWFENKQE